MRAKMAFSWEQNCLRRCVFSSGMICSRNLRKTSSMCCLDMNYIKKNSLSSAIIQAVFRYGSHLVLRSDFLLLRRRLVYNHGYHQHASGILDTVQFYCFYNFCLCLSRESGSSSHLSARGVSTTWSTTWSAVLSLEALSLC